MSSTVRKMSVTGETGSYIFILTVSKMPNIYIVWDKKEFKLFGLMWVKRHTVLLPFARARSFHWIEWQVSVVPVSSNRRCITAPVFSSSCFRSPCCDLPSLSVTQLLLEANLLVCSYWLWFSFTYCISYREQNRCKTFSDKIALIVTKIFSRARGRTPALSVSFNEQWCQVFWAWGQYWERSDIARDKKQITKNINTWIIILVYWCRHWVQISKTHEHKTNREMSITPKRFY